jgi:hypothetical protein
MKVVYCAKEPTLQIVIHFSLSIPVFFTSEKARYLKLVYSGKEQKLSSLTPHFLFFLFLQYNTLLGEKTRYLKLVYSAKEPKLPRGLTGNTFAGVYGTNSSALELFLVRLTCK